MPPELTLDLDVVDVKLHRNELLMKQQKQEHYKSHLLALLKKLKEDERLLSKVLQHPYGKIWRVVKSVVFNGCCFCEVSP